MCAPLPDEELRQSLSDVQILLGRPSWIRRQPEKKRRKHLRCHESLSFRGWLKIHGAQFYTLLKVFRRLSVISLQYESGPIIGLRKSCVLEQTELCGLQGPSGVLTSLESGIE